MERIGVGRRKEERGCCFEFNQSSPTEIRLWRKRRGRYRRLGGGVFCKGKESLSFFPLLRGRVSQLIFHLGAARSFIRQRDRGVCGGSVELLHYSLKPGEIGPR